MNLSGNYLILKKTLQQESYDFFLALFGIDDFHTTDTYSLNNSNSAKSILKPEI